MAMTCPRALSKLTQSFDRSVAAHVVVALVAGAKNYSHAVTRSLDVTGCASGSRDSQLQKPRIDGGLYRRSRVFRRTRSDRPICPLANCSGSSEIISHQDENGWHRSQSRRARTSSRPLWQHRKSVLQNCARPTRRHHHVP